MNMLALAVTDAQKSSIAEQFTEQNHCILRVGVKQVTQTPQSAMMKVQQTLFRYGVVPVASLAGAAPGPVPRTDPPSTTGQEEQPAKHKGTSKTRANGNPTGPQCQTPVSGGKEGRSKRKRKQETLNILQYNACGIGPKKFELAHILDKHKIHVALIQETDLGKNDSTFISNYTATNCSCQTCRGTTTYIRNDVTGQTENLDLNPTCMQLSTIWHSNEKFSIFNVYNPPVKEIRLPSSVIDSCILKKTVLAGDFNGHSPLWGYRDLNKTGKAVEDLCSSTNLCLVQDSTTQPTLQHKYHKTLHRPDLTLVSSDISSKYQYEVIDGIGDSDHRPMITRISSPNKKVSKRQTRWNFQRASWDIYQETSNKLLREVDMTSDNTEEIYEAISSSILKAASLSIPKGCRQKYKPFWNDELETAVNAREKARNRKEQNPSIPNRIAYNRATAQVKRLINTSKRDNFRSTCSNLDLAQEGHKAWTLVQNLSGDQRRTNPQPLKSDGQLLVEDQKRANEHNKFFASISRADKLSANDKRLIEELKAEESTPGPNIKTFEEELTMTEFNKALKKLKARKSPGPDKIHNEMLRHLGIPGKKVLLSFINKTWNEGTLPDSWKIATIKPILKKGKPADDLKSYRPISLSSCFGKLAERMINQRLYWYLESNKILNVAQAGFRNGHRCEDQLFRLSQKIIDGFHDKKSTTAVFVDLQQAYDRVWRKGLLLKMQKLGVKGRLYNWIKNFLTNRIIQTKVNDALSSKKMLEEGLPQGSSLSCTLFLIFINDLPDILKSEKALYADDLVLWNTHTVAGISAMYLNADLKRLETYCQRWKLKLNQTKTVYTVFSNSSRVADRNLPLRYEGQQLSKEKNPVYLGVTLDPRMTLQKHMRNVKDKATRRLNIVKRLAGTTWGADKSTLRQLYLGYVRSSMEYNLALQIVSSETNRDTLDRVESNALHFIAGAMRSTPTAACHIHTNVQPLRLRREAAVLEMVERYRREDDDQPNAQIVKGWKENTRIKKNSILKAEKQLQEKHHLPANREIVDFKERNLPPGDFFYEPTVNLELKESVSKKTTDPLELHLTGVRTILDYPDDHIHVYTDGSAFKGTINAGLGVRIEYPEGSLEEISFPCGNLCSNFDAEAYAIKAAIESITGTFHMHPSLSTDVVVFSDSKSVLQCLKNESLSSRTIKDLILTLTKFSDEFNKDITFQWIPSHCNIEGNEAADKLAKEGSTMEQPETAVPQSTCKQIIKSNIQIEWMCNWAQDKHGRTLFPYMPKPDKKDPLNQLNRKQQTIIFRLRTQHVPLNAHLNRFNPMHEPHCPLCDHAYETVEHFLFDCPKLKDIRESLLPPKPDIENTLFGNADQLGMTSEYFVIANKRRANAHI